MGTERTLVFLSRIIFSLGRILLSKLDIGTKAYVRSLPHENVQVCIAHVNFRVLRILLTFGLKAPCERHVDSFFYYE